LLYPLHLVATISYLLFPGSITAASCLPATSYGPGCQPRLHTLLLCCAATACGTAAAAAGHWWCCNWAACQEAWQLTPRQQQQQGMSAPQEVMVDRVCLWV